VREALLAVVKAIPTAVVNAAFSRRERESDEWCCAALRLRPHAVETLWSSPLRDRSSQLTNPADPYLLSLSGTYTATQNTAPPCHSCLPNVDRFWKFYHRHTLQKSCCKIATKYSIAPETRTKHYSNALVG